MGGIVVVVPLVFIALSLSSQREMEPPVPVSPPEATTTDARQVEEAALPPTAASGPEPVAGTSEPAAPALAVATAGSPGTGEEMGKEGADERKRWRYLLMAEAREQTWMAVTSDRGERRQVLLRAGEQARFVADEGFLVTVGNAGGVTLTLNGASLPLLGTSGEVVRNLSLPGEGSLPPPPGASGARR
jgi:cytoskeleton protein RodZ